MKYSNLKWLPINTIAELWAKDPNSLPQNELWNLLWQAIWKGEFEDPEGRESRWGTFAVEHVRAIDSLKLATPLDKIISQEILTRTRRQMILSMREAVEFYWFVPEIRDELFEASKNPKTIYESITKRMHLLRYPLSLKDVPMDAKEDARRHILFWRSFIEMAAIRTDAFIGWVLRMNFDMPSFLKKDAPTENKKLFAQRIYKWFVEEYAPQFDGGPHRNIPNRAADLLAAEKRFSELQIDREHVREARRTYAVTHPLWRKGGNKGQKSGKVLK